MSKELLDTHFYRAQQIKPENELPPKLIKESDRKNLRDFGVTVFETPQALVEPLNKVLVSDRDYAKFTHLSSEAILSLLDKPDISQLGEDLTGQRKESLAIVQWTLHAKQGQFSGSFQEDTTTHIDRREFVSYPTREFKDSYLRGQTNALTAWFSILEGNQSILTYFMNPDEELYDSEFPGFISRKSIFDENNQFTQNIVELAEHFNAMSENGLDKNHVKSWYQALVVEEFRNSENGFPESVDQNELDRHKTDNLLNTTSKLFQCRNAEFLKGSRLMQILPLYRNQCVVHDMDAVHSSMRLIANEETKPRVAGVIRWADRDMLKGAYHGEEPSNFRDALKTDERLRDIMLKLEEAYNVPFGTLPVLGGEKVEIINENLALVPPKLLIQVIQSLDK